MHALYNQQRVESGYDIWPMNLSNSVAAMAVAAQHLDLTPIVSTMEYYFSDVNLFGDNYLRDRMMPVEGWVSLLLISSFPRMRTLGADFFAVRQAVSHSSMLELDGTGNYVRIRDEARRKCWLPQASGRDRHPAAQGLQR